MRALEVSITGISPNQPIPKEFAKAVPAANGKGFAPAPNIRPAMRWSEGPEGTQSYAILMVDPDVPHKFDDANQDGKTLPKDMPRMDFFHWLQANIPTDITALAEGPAGPVELGVSGQNSYGDSGTNGGVGYDGPCPPWNDERLHHYHFIVYALDTDVLDLDEGFSGEEFRAAIDGHVLAQGEVIGSYTTNTQLRNAA